MAGFETGVNQFLFSFFQEAQAEEEYYDENPDEEEAHEED